MTVIEKFTAFYEDLASMQTSQLKHIYSKDVEFIDPIAKHQGIKSVEHYFDRLLHNAKFCEFDIKTVEQTLSERYVVAWQMTFTSDRMNKGKPIKVDGLTLLHLQNDLIVYHRDYYDLGQMVYENIPVLGFIVKKIKKGMN